MTNTISQYYVAPCPPEANGAAGPVIKSIQQVGISMSSSETEKTADIDEVDPANTVAYLLGWNLPQGPICGVFTRISLINGTTVKAERPSTGGYSHPTTRICVVEFEKGIKSIQQEVVEIPAGSRSCHHAIDEIDITKTILFPGGWTCGSGGFLNVSQGFFPYIWISNSTTIYVYRLGASDIKEFVGVTAVELE